MSGSLFSPVPRWVLVEAAFSFSAKAIHSLSSLLAHVGAVHPTSHWPAIHWLLPTFCLQAGSRSRHAALRPALGVPVLPLHLPHLQAGDVRVLRALPLLPPPLSRRGCCLPSLQAQPRGLSQALPFLLLTKVLEGLAGLWLVWGGLKVPADPRQGSRGRAREAAGQGGGVGGLWDAG